MTDTIFSKTLATIEKYGWWNNGTGRGPNGEMCVMHALRQHTNRGDRFVLGSSGHNLDKLACEVMTAYLIEHYNWTAEIFKWNDNCATFADVKAMLVHLHEKLMEIGEEKKEVEFVPMTEPSVVPVESPSVTPEEAPVDTPVEEPVPA
jgi:hypothetical protein